MVFEFADLQDRSAVSEPHSPISYLTDGEEGNRIFKFEYKNAGFSEEISETGSAPSFANVQFWLYESDNSWESRIGTSNVENASLNFDEKIGPVLGYFEIVDGNSLSSYLLNDSNNPVTMDSVDLLDYYAFLGIEIPEENTVIRFYDISVGSKSPIEVKGINLFPSLASEQLTLTIDNPDFIGAGATVKIYDISGKRYFKTVVIADGTYRIPLNHLASGQYYLSIQSDKGFKTLPFVKQ